MVPPCKNSGPVWAQAALGQVWRFSHFLLNALNEDINKNNKKLKNLISNEVLNNKLNEMNNMNTELKYDDGRYIGQVVNGKPDGKGIFYFNDGNRYEGDFKNGKKEGKVIFYGNNGDKEMGDYHNDKPIGKHVGLTKYGEVKIINY